jgi:hypothetical protein
MGGRGQRMMQMPYFSKKAPLFVVTKNLLLGASYTTVP